MVVNPRADSGSTTTVNRALLPVTVLVIGIVLTTLMAMVQQRSAEREQALIFERQVMKNMFDLPTNSTPRSRTSTTR